MAKIFLTGATGFIGSFVAKQFIKHDHQVICMIRKNSNLRWIANLPVKFWTGSFFDPESYKDAIKNADYVVHLAGVTKALDKREYYNGNVKLTRKLLETISAVNPDLQKFIYVSSQAAAGPSPSRELIDENHPMQPLTDYGYSKMESEKLVEKFNEVLPVCIIRPSAVYGPRDTDVLNFFKNMKKGVNLQVGRIDQLVSMVYVEDLAEGIVQATVSENTNGNRYFVCEEPPYRWSYVGNLTGEIMEKRYVTIRVPYFIALGVASILEMYSSFSKKPTILNRQKMKEIKQPFWTVTSKRARDDFDYKTHYPLELGIRKTLDWYEEHDWL